MKNLPLRYTISRIGEPTLQEFAASQMTLDTPQAVREFWDSAIAGRPDHEPEKEILVAICLNTKLRPIGWHLIATGTVNECVAHPREIFRPPIIAAAYALVIAHNHPSGDPSPSQADRRLTSTLREASQLLQISLIDHIIVGLPQADRPGHYSFRDSGLL